MFVGVFGIVIIMDIGWGLYVMYRLLRDLLVFGCIIFDCRLIVRILLLRLYYIMLRF